MDTAEWYDSVCVDELRQLRPEEVTEMKRPPSSLVFQLGQTDSYVYNDNPLALEGAGSFGSVRLFKFVNKPGDHEGIALKEFYEEEDNEIGVVKKLGRACLDTRVIACTVNVKRLARGGGMGLITGYQAPRRAILMQSASSLGGYIEQSRARLDIDSKLRKVKQILLQVAKGVLCIYEKTGGVYTDIKVANMLVVGSQPTFLLGDLGSVTLHEGPSFISYRFDRRREYDRAQNAIDAYIILAWRLIQLFFDTEQVGDLKITSTNALSFVNEKLNSSFVVLGLSSSIKDITAMLTEMARLADSPDGVGDSVQSFFENAQGILGSFAHPRALEDEYEDSLLYLLS